MNFKSINSAEAYRRLISNQNSVLIDVRTRVEWLSVGVPFLERRVIFSSWPLDMEPLLIQNFLADFKAQIAAQKIFTKSAEQLELFFICKAGVRSALAAEAAGIFAANCYNIIDGWQGAYGEPGWRNNNLPWRML